MGCDIHAHVEVKLIDGNWHHWSAPWIERNYGLFAKMAGVRQRSEPIEPISLPRGIPEDISALTAIDLEQWGSDGHDHSWLSREEIGQLAAFWKAQDPKNHWDFEVRIMGGYLAGSTYTERLPADVVDVRMVFWFDN